MKLSFSNIAWPFEQDAKMYTLLKEHGFSGIELAPTRIFPNKPYEMLKEAEIFAAKLLEHYNLAVSSIQSIWYGRTENIFNSENERKILIEYTKKAIDFAVCLKCSNLVFGCPNNRNMHSDANIQTAYDFFYEIASYANKKGTNIALEPNPSIYNTNFINTTPQAFEFAKKVEFLKVNIDCGTIIANGEDINIIADNISLINHIHISEPHLAQIQKRSLHKDLMKILKENAYKGYVSVEMKNFNDSDIIKKTAIYIREIFL